MLRRVCRSISFRLKLARFGVHYIRSRSLLLHSLRIAGRRVALSFPEGEEGVLEYELRKILLDDCYRLAAVPSPTGVKTVLDIGGNIGLFGLAARHFFPTATIHCYEPNGCLEPYLQRHCAPLSVDYHLEAVGAEPGYVSLEMRENSLHTTAHPGGAGSVPQVAFRTALDRIGGRADVLKLDCEGAEWSLFEDQESWARVGFLTMEYHLWARREASLNDLLLRVDSLGFECLLVEPSVNGSFGMLQARNCRTKRCI